MSVTLAATWNPRGELNRIARHSSRLLELYDTIEIVMPPQSDPAVVEAAQQIRGLHVTHWGDWGSGRHVSLRLAVDTGSTHIHYCDLDRLLHWFEAYPDELESIVQRISDDDAGCIIFGRTEQAWQTHPASMRETEALFNRVFSHLLGSTMDFGAGSKSFTHEAARTILRHSPPESSSFAADTAWPVILKYAGFDIAYVEVDGLAWETPDQGLDTIASDLDRRKAIAIAEQSAEHWRQRVEVASRIITAGLDCLRNINTQDASQEIPRE